MKIYTHDYPPDFGDAVRQEDIDTVKQFLDKGIVDVRYNLLAFEAALDTIITQALYERPLDFKLPDLILTYGFQIKAYRSLLITHVLRETESWFYDMCDGADIPETPDSVSSAYLIKNGAELNFLSNETKTALDYAIEGEEYSNQIVKHPKAEKALREAGAKRVSELSHEEFVLAHDLARICLRQDWDDIHYYIHQGQPDVAELFTGLARCIGEYTRAPSLTKAREWEEIINFLLVNGAQVSCYVTIDHKYKKMSGLHDCIFNGVKNHLPPELIQHKLKFLLQKNVEVNKVLGGKATALDAAYQHQNQPAIALLRQHGAQTLAELQAEGRIRGQGHEMQLISDDEAEAAP